MPTDPKFNERVQKFADQGTTMGNDRHERAVREGEAAQKEMVGKGGKVGGVQSSADDNGIPSLGPPLAQPVPPMPPVRRETPDHFKEP